MVVNYGFANFRKINLLGISPEMRVYKIYRI